MKSHRQTLFLGNGLNRCINNMYSWDNVISKLCEEYNMSSFSDIPLTMVFEAIAANNSVSNNNDIYIDLKKNIAKNIEKTFSFVSELYQLFTSLSFNSFITTNYDYMIEYSIDGNFELSKNRINGNQKYVFTEAFPIKNKNVYHIHGEIAYPKTLCLGYEHYIGVVERLRKDIHTSIAKDNRNIQSLNKNHYAYDFFFNDVYIVALGLDYNEIDIWWLLNYRAMLLKNGEISNKVIYYSIDKTEDTNKKRLLESFKVEWRFLQIKDNSEYQEKYKIIAYQIEKELQYKI